MTTLTALAPYPVFRDTTRASRPPAQMVASADREFEDLRRDAPDLGVNGVHPTAVKALIGVYGVLLLTFWAFFGALGGPLPSRPPSAVLLRCPVWCFVSSNGPFELARALLNGYSESPRG